MGVGGRRHPFSASRDEQPSSGTRRRFGDCSPPRNRRRIAAPKLLYSLRAPPEPVLANKPSGNVEHAKPSSNLPQTGVKLDASNRNLQTTKSKRVSAETMTRPVFASARSAGVHTRRSAWVYRAGLSRRIRESPMRLPLGIGPAPLGAGLRRGDFAATPRPSYCGVRATTSEWLGSRFQPRSRRHRRTDPIESRSIRPPGCSPHLSRSEVRRPEGSRPRSMPLFPMDRKAFRGADPKRSVPKNGKAPKALSRCCRRCVLPANTRVTSCLILDRPRIASGSPPKTGFFRATPVSVPPLSGLAPRLGLELAVAGGAGGRPVSTLCGASARGRSAANTSVLPTHDISRHQPRGTRKCGDTP